MSRHALSLRACRWRRGVAPTGGQLLLQRPGRPAVAAIVGKGQPQHVDHLAAFTAGSFGGPDRFTRELGFEHLIAVHRGLHITEEQRVRFVDLYLAALDEAGMPDDEPFRAAVRSHVEFGSRVAMQSSNATRDDELHPLREVPRWTWAGDDNAQVP
ncbi:MAG: hypothetical protein ABJA86_09540 [Nocardioidaceae bacterium]